MEVEIRAGLDGWIEIGSSFSEEMKEDNKFKEMIEEKKFDLTQHAHVQKFSDMTKDFGICFSLSNSTNGILFNDKSSIIIHRLSGEVYYQSRDKNIIRFFYKKVPKVIEIQNKFAVLKEYLRANNLYHLPRSKKQRRPIEDFNVIKTWGKKENSVYMFTLKNIIQLIFKDGSFLFYFREEERVIVIDGEEQLIFPYPYPLEEITNVLYNKPKALDKFREALIFKDNFI